MIGFGNRAMSLYSRNLLPSFSRAPARVSIRKAPHYDGDLEAILLETVREFRLDVRGKCILLKPNLVGMDTTGCSNTHPAVIRAARECFFRLGARRIIVADGPALERDTEAILESVSLREHLGQLSQNFVDLNTDNVQRITLRTRASRLKELWLPQAVLEADLVVSIPKMKTHRWAGVTLSLKNMFGIVPGSCYGWPKNILHWVGITQALLDINAAVCPDFCIVDGIVGMEGNGPVQGSPTPCGVLVCGDDPVAVDATSARLMGIQPEGIDSLLRASYMLGHIKEESIAQIGERIATVAKPFQWPPFFKPRRMHPGAKG